MPRGCAGCAIRLHRPSGAAWGRFTIYWAVIAVAAIFTLARFSEAFLILRAVEVGLIPMLVPLVLVAMNAVYVLSARPAGELSDRMNRPTLLPERRSGTGFSPIHCVSSGIGPARRPVSLRV